MKTLLKIRGLIIFLALFFIPLFSVIFINVKFFSKFVFLYNDPLYLILTQYGIFLILLAVIYFSKKKIIDFISGENWFYSLGKAFIPAVLAFGTGLLLTSIFIIGVEYLPFPKFIKEWTSIPNQGYIEIIEQIKKENHIKVILWFIIITVIGPVIEEIAFRGFLQDSMKRYFKKYDLDVYITALLFSLFHYVSLSNVIYAFIVGYFLSKQRKIYSSINTSIFMHGLLNFAGLVMGIVYFYIAAGK